MSNLDDTRFVDPDPFTVISLVLSGAGVLLQLPQAYQQLKDKFKSGDTVKLNANQETILDHFDDELRNAQQLLDRVIKSIDRGSAAPEEEFYNVKFGISLSIMKLDVARQKSFTRDLSSLYQKMGAVSSWANTIIGGHDQLASKLGHMLSERCEDAHTKLNKMMADGATNGQILAEAKYIFTSMQTCLDEISKNGNF